MTPHPAHTRTSYRRGHPLLTPDIFIRVRLPGMNRASAVVHAAPFTHGLFPGGCFVRPDPAHTETSYRRDHALLTPEALICAPLPAVNLATAIVHAAPFTHGLFPGGCFVRPDPAHTRTSYRRDHALLTPDTFIRAPLPGMKRATAVVHDGPAMGAAFTQYTAELEPGGSLSPAGAQRFLFVLEGEALVEAGSRKHRRMLRDLP